MSDTGAGRNSAPHVSRNNPRKMYLNSEIRIVYHIVWHTQTDMNLFINSSHVIWGKSQDICITTRSKRLSAVCSIFFFLHIIQLVSTDATQTVTYSLLKSQVWSALYSMTIHHNKRAMMCPGFCYPSSFWKSEFFFIYTIKAFQSEIFYEVVTPQRTVPKVWSYRNSD